MSRGERIRWDVRLSKPLADGGATICEKHDFALANYEDPSMTREVRQSLEQAKDDGERMERRIQDLGEEANNLEECLDDAEKEIARLKIAHLRRMADSVSIDAAWSRFCDGRRRNRGSMQRAWDRLKRFESACLAKITELKESQCSTKS